MKKLVFIDESGNPGIKDEQGQFVIVGILIIREEDLNNISREFSRVKRAMHCADDFEFKFSKTKKKIIFDLFERLKDINFEVYAIVFEKKEFLNTVVIVIIFASILAIITVIGFILYKKYIQNKIEY